MSMSNTTKRVKEIRRKTRPKFSSEEKIRIVLDGLRGESSIGLNQEPECSRPIALVLFEFLKTLDTFTGLNVSGPTK